MPAWIGSIQIMNVGDGVVHFGDSFNLSPKSNSKTSQGSGSANIGAFIATNNGLSISPTFDPDLFDQPAVANQ